MRRELWSQRKSINNEAYRFIEMGKSWNNKRYLLILSGLSNDDDRLNITKCSSSTRKIQPLSTDVEYFRLEEQNDSWKHLKELEYVESWKKNRRMKIDYEYHGDERYNKRYSISSNVRALND